MKTRFFAALAATVAMAQLNCGGAGVVPADVAVVPQDPQASYVQLKDLTFKELMPGVLAIAPLAGDPNTGAHDTLVRFTAGKSLPSHFYTNAQNGFVLEGTLEQPTPSNQSNVVTMTAGSSFYFPAKAEHSSSCAPGKDCLFLIHQDGAFDFVPNTATVATDKVPQNPDAMFTLASSLKFDSAVPGAVDMAAVRGDRTTGAHTTIIRVAPGASLPSHYYTNEMRGIVLSGPLEQPAPANETVPSSLVLGSFFKFAGKLAHGTTCKATTPCTFYVHQPAAFDLVMVK